MPIGPPARVCQKSKFYSTGFRGELADGGSGLLLQHFPGPLQRHRGGVDEGRVGGAGHAQVQGLGEGLDGGTYVAAGEVGPAEVLADGRLLQGALGFGEELAKDLDSAVEAVR